MERFRSLHIWMLVPLAIMQLGIFGDYWGDLTQNAWSVHVHYWTATIWYLFLVVQPYLATHRRLEQHRTNGILGIFFAGGVAITALSMLHRDIANADLSARMPERFGPFEPWFFFGVAAVEIVMMSAFVFAVVQAIRHRRSLEDHAWWLVSTVFLIMMPALGRGIQNLGSALFGPEKTMMSSLYLTTLVIVALTLWAARRFGRVGHPATALAVGVNLFNLLLEPLGRWEWLQAVLRATIKG